MKRCTKCGELKPLTNFYRNATKRDGFNPWCKDCQESYMAEYRQRNRKRRSEYIAKWKTTPKGRGGQQRDGRSLRRRRPEVIRARRAVNYAVESGKLTREPCKFCGDPQVEAHHEDYSKPLDVIWACFKCHREKLHGHIVISEETKS